MSNKFVTLTSHLPNSIRIDKEAKSMATYLISIQSEVEQGRIALRLLVVFLASSI
jgi:hypothetical protein